MRFRPTLTLAATALGLAACTDTTEPVAAPSTVSVRTESGDRTPGTISLSKIGGFDGGGPQAAEITAYDARSKRLFVVNGALGSVDVFDLTNPALPTRVATLSGPTFGGSVNSVASYEGIIAVAVENATKTNPGTVVFLRGSTLEILSQVTVGALPDMVTFSPDGRYVLVANEGEPNSSYTVDPEGSVSIIDVRRLAAPSVRTATFRKFNGQEAALRAQGIRIYGPNASAAQDFEPEYITVVDEDDDTDRDDKDKDRDRRGRRGGRGGRDDDRDLTAYVTLQENNAIAIVDVRTASVRSIAPLGYKNHTLPGNGFDASDRDTSNVRIRNWPVLGMYQPDAIASYTVRGQTYLITANEGDAREYLDAPGFVEEARVSTLSLNPSVFTVDRCFGQPCSNAGALGRLTVTRALGQNPVTGQYDALYVLGGRSFSVWKASGRQVTQVWDSGDQFERNTTALGTVNFNASNNNNTFDDRSDNKGPEPEGVVLGQLGKKTYAFIGLERVGGVMVYDVTNPASPIYTTYINTRSGTTGDRGPEGLIFVPAKASPSRQPLLIVGNETSGTTAIYQIALQ